MMTLLGLTLMFAVPGPSMAAPSELPKALVGVHRIVCMGDSITQMGDTEGGHGYVRLIRETLAKVYPNVAIEVINAGIGGQKAPDMQARWQSDVLDKNPDLVTLSVGINDVWHGFYDNHPLGDGPRGVNLSLYSDEVRQMVISATARKIRVILVSPTVITEDERKLENKKLKDYVEAERKIARSMHIPFVDLHSVFLKELSKRRVGPDDQVLRLTVDGVHMQPDGDKLMAYSILKSLGVKGSDLRDLSIESQTH